MYNGDFCIDRNIIFQTFLDAFYKLYAYTFFYSSIAQAIKRFKNINPVTISNKVMPGKWYFT